MVLRYTYILQNHSLNMLAIKNLLAVNATTIGPVIIKLGRYLQAMSS